MQTNITGACGARSQCFSHTRFAPLRCVCFPRLYCSGPSLLCWELSDAGPGLHALPRSKLLRFRFLGTPQKCRLGWACVFCPSQVRAAQVTRCLASAVAPSWGLWLTPSPVPAARFSGLQLARLLFWGADLRLRSSRRMSTIQNPKKSWLATKSACSSVWDASLGLRLPPSSSGCPCLPVSGGEWAGPHSASSLFCEGAWRGLSLGLFAG